MQEIKPERKILNVLKKRDTTNILDLAETTNMDRHTVAKYLEILKTKGLVDYSTKGKSKLWKTSNNQFSEILGINEHISNQVLGILKNLDYNVSIQSKNYDIIWHNSKNKKGKCYEIKQGKKIPCKNCPSDKVFKTGKAEKRIIKQDGEEKTIISEPIKNEEGKVIAVIELTKPNKEK